MVSISFHIFMPLKILLLKILPLITQYNGLRTLAKLASFLALMLKGYANVAMLANLR